MTVREKERLNSVVNEWESGNSQNRNKRERGIQRERERGERKEERERERERLRLIKERNIHVFSTPFHGVVFLATVVGHLYL
jgi:hypothetical protein